MASGGGNSERRTNPSKAGGSVSRSRGAAVARLSLIIPLVLLCIPTGVRGQPAHANPRSLQAERLLPGESITLDGRLDEPAWLRANVATDFLQREPHEGRAATERTEVRVLYDDQHLYMGVKLFDGTPGEILAYQRRRNASLATDDRFAWTLDTFEDGRSAYYFEINPLGMMGDGLLRAVGQGGGLNRSWDGIWNVRTSRSSQGWTAEIRIPFRTLNFDPERASWGINFLRTIRRKNEEALWSGYRRNQGILRPQDGGRLLGLEGMSQGIGLEAKPYVTAGVRHIPMIPEERYRTPYNTGVDLTYSVTTNLRAALTVNTDFAEAEVDQRRVNLTRFPLFYPERRDFFLEGSGVFSFAAASGVNPYFSRRLGLVAGEPIPILFGARLAGQAGSYDLGFLQIRTGRKEAVPAEDFTVGRVVKNILAESSAGVIYTRRATAAFGDLPSLPDRHTAGVDVELNTSRFLGDQNLQFQGFFVWHNANSLEDTLHWGHRTARGFRIAYPNQPFGGHVSYREFGDAFDPAVGFTPRRGLRRFQPTLSFTPWLERSPVVRQLGFSFRHEYLMDLGYRPETVNNTFTLLGVRFETGDAAEIAVSHNFERLPHDARPFEIFPGILIPPGRYAGWDARVAAESARHRPLSASFEARRGHFWSGSRTQLYAGGTIRPRAGYSFGAEWSHSDVSLREGSFATYLVRASTDLDVSPRVFLTANVQYDNVSRVIGLYSRFRWIIRPGSDLYVVYQHNWLDEPDRMMNLGNAATMKATYAHRF